MHIHESKIPWCTLKWKADTCTLILEKGKTQEYKDMRT